jgi:hypothetical protein
MSTQESLVNRIAAADILAWIDANPEGFNRITVRKSWGRKVWWQGPDGRDYDTLADCVRAAIRHENRSKPARP